MLNKILREIVALIVGKGAEPIADLLNSKTYVNEFMIAKKLGITINQTRNMLYKISDHGLVSSERKKDKKKGWYTYYWKFEIMKCLEFLKNNILESKERFLTQIQRRQEKQFYVCEDCGLEYSEDDALLMEFECDECGELFTIKDNSKLLVGLKKNVEALDEKIADIDVEIEKEQKRLGRKKNIMLRKEAKEKEAKKEEARLRRAAKKKEKEALAKKEARKKAKAVPKKKAAVKKKVAKKAVKKKVAPKQKTVKKVVKKKVAPKKKVAKKTVKKSTKKAAPKKKASRKK